MANPTTIDTFINEQVETGVYASPQEAQQEILAELLERDLDQRIAKGRKAVAEGRVRTLSTESNQAFLKSIEEKLLAK